MPRGLASQSEVTGNRALSSDVSSEKVPTRRAEKKAEFSLSSPGAWAAFARSIVSQFFTFYFRVPLKLFRPQRFDYLVVPRALNAHIQAGEPWSLKQTTIPVLFHAIKKEGWAVIPRHVLPPFLANTVIGFVLYTTYAICLPMSRQLIPVSASYTAGAMAGTMQSIVSQPLLALTSHFEVEQFLKGGKYKSMWSFASQTLQQIGPRGVFQGFSLSVVKESVGYGVFFSSFETVRQRSETTLLPTIRDWVSAGRRLGTQKHADSDKWVVTPASILLAGLSASTAHQVVHHPLSQLQNLHLAYVGTEDYQRTLHRKPFSSPFTAYRATWQQALLLARQSGHTSLLPWLYRGFLGSTLRNLPGTSAALIVFESFRRRLDLEAGTSEVSLGYVE